MQNSSASRSQNYRSCIRIGGRAILPPLITDERRASLELEKTKAIEVERRLQHNRNLRLLCDQNQERLPVPELNTSSDSSGIFTRSIDSSHVDNDQRHKPYSSHSQSESLISPNKANSSILAHDSSSICDTVTNFGSTETTPDKNSTVNLLPNCEIDYGHKRSRSNNVQSDGTYVVSKGTSDEISPQPQPIAYYNDGRLIETVDLSSPIVFSRSDNCDENEYNSVFENSDILTDSDNSVLRMLPESIKGSNDNNNNHNDRGVSNVSRINEQNLNLSPCKDLVLKSDVFTAINSSNITVRGHRRNLNLSKDFLMFNDGLCTDDNVNKLETVDNSEVGENCDLNKNDVKIDVNDDVNKKSTICKTPPKLVRQNSYTLDSPSPELVAFVERQRQKDLNKKPGLLKRTHTWTLASSKEENKEYLTKFKPFQSNKDITRRSRRFWNVQEAKEQWDKQKEDLYSQVVNVNSNELKQRYKFTESSSPTSDRSYKIPGKSKVQARSADCVFSLTNDSQNSDRSGDNNKQIRHTTGKIISLKSHRGTDVDYNLRNLDNSLKLNDVMKTDSMSTMTLTPEKDITCDNTSIHDVPYSTCSSTSSDCISSNQTLKNAINDDSVSMCSSVSLNRFMSALFSTDKSLPTDDAHCYELRLRHYKEFKELLLRQEEELQTFISSRSPSIASNGRSTLSPPIVSRYSLCHHSSPPKEFISQPTRLSSELASSQARSCMRQLNFNIPKFKKCALEYTDEERKAALIITAYAKGYLVRRLFKTEKVQEIIKSIKDSLSCAINFDYANKANWKQADADLHARLITQIEAASFAFRDVCNLSTKKKMAIINADRQKKMKARKLQYDAPVLSAVTRRVIMRKKMQPQTVAKSNPSHTRHQKLRQRRRSFTGFSNITNSYKTQQPMQLQKSASTGATNRQPWK